MWKLIMLVVNSQDVYFIDYDFQFYNKSFRNDSSHQLILNFHQTSDYSISQGFLENEFDYNLTIYNRSQIIASENYLFVFLDNFWNLVLTILLQICIYIAFVITPWIIINLNLIAFVFVTFDQNKQRVYYHKIREALKQFFEEQKERNICRSVYRTVFIMITFLISIIILTDFIYLIINQIAKSNFNTIADMITNGSIGCFYINDTFLQDLFQKERGIRYKVGTSQLQCLQMLEQKKVDVVIMSEFSLLLALTNNPQYLNKLRYQVKLNTIIAHYFLVNNNQPDWFTIQLQQAIDYIQKQKLDLLVKDKYLPTKFYNSKNTSIMPNQPTFTLCCSIISIFFILIIQITLVYKEYHRNKQKIVFKKYQWIYCQKLKIN